MNSKNEIQNGVAKTVADKSSGSWVAAHLSIGSNLGDSRSCIESALQILKEHDSIKITSVSDYFKTEPVDMHDGGNFINCAVGIETNLSPLELLDSLEEIEHLLGRKTKRDNKPRTIDIDIIYYGGMVVVFPRLQVPHPKMAQRRFVLEPLAQIAPDIKHPTLHQTPAELVMAVSNHTGHCWKIENTGV
ncbi:MAG: 2-amino-4-hydroxy-6-hydroxymethyldihydropteridine diphosphokinase [Nitrospinota bacterium]|nr:2-amino-4-hydroxy-6-hydroxymethyldihydropteridine diphosphokinase [Nitrospinota bacterium]